MKRIIAIIASLVLVATMATAAYAASSPTGDKTFQITITTNKDSGEKQAIVQNGDTYELTADEDDENNAFTEWKITGNYEIVSGSLTSKFLVIRPLGDVSVEQVFEKIGEEDDDVDSEDEEDVDSEDDTESSDSSKGETNKSDTSPTTGNNWFLYLGGVFVASLLIAGATKKFAK